jgi:23S rRNA pseudouridine2605 synthase
MIRLNKYLAQAGVASRRKSDELIERGKVKVNGKVVTEMGVIVDENNDQVEYAGRILKSEGNDVYIILNKPANYVCSATSSQGASVLELVNVSERVYPVGRLDKDARGLVLLTNDGELTNKVTHPKYGSKKEYRVVIDKPLKEKDAGIMKSGMILEGKKLQPVGVSGIGEQIVKLVLTEGVNRQIKKMMGHLNYRVKDLQRTKIGKLDLGKLKEGEWKKINKEDII